MVTFSKSVPVGFAESCVKDGETTVTACSPRPFDTSGRVLPSGVETCPFGERPSEKVSECAAVFVRLERTPWQSPCSWSALRVAPESLCDAILETLSKVSKVPEGSLRATGGGPRRVLLVLLKAFCWVVRSIYLVKFRKRS